MAAAPSPAMQAMIDAYRSADGRVKDLIGKQQALDAQLTENGMVRTELDALKEGEPVYKLQGKILVLHDPSEAKATVSQRITMIEGEMWVAGRWARASPPHPAPNRLTPRPLLSPPPPALARPAQRKAEQNDHRGAAVGAKNPQRHYGGAAGGGGGVGGRARGVLNKRALLFLEFFL